MTRKKAEAYHSNTLKKARLLDLIEVVRTNVRLGFIDFAEQKLDEMQSVIDPIEKQRGKR